MDKRASLRRVVATHLAIIGLVSFQTSTAVEIISNMPGNDGTSTFINGPVGGANGGGVFNSKAVGFSTPGDAYDLDFVTLRLNFFDTFSQPLVHIYSDLGGNPGSVLHTLIPPAPVVGTSNFQFNSGGFTLAGSTTYWIVVWNDTTVANSFQWMASVPSVTPTGLATHVGYRFSNGPPPPTGASSTFNSYSVNATLVPEPTTLFALALGGMALMLRSRRTRN